ncbi:MAG TPA: hypothetical protein V6C95_00870 [Coleofasciculaceae cyanobacterium]
MNSLGRADKLLRLATKRGSYAIAQQRFDFCRVGLNHRKCQDGQHKTQA